MVGYIVEYRHFWGLWETHSSVIVGGLRYVESSCKINRDGRIGRGFPGTLHSWLVRQDSKTTSWAADGGYLNALGQDFCSWIWDLFPDMKLTWDPNNICCAKPRWAPGKMKSVSSSVNDEISASLDSVRTRTLPSALCAKNDNARCIRAEEW